MCHICIININNNNTPIHLTSVMPHTEITEALGTKCKRDLNESNITSNPLLGNRLFQTVEAVRLKAFLGIAN